MGNISKINLIRISLLCLGIVVAILIAANTMLSPKDDREKYNLTLASVYITGENDDFWGYEEGILVPGKLFDDYLQDNGLDADTLPDMNTDANFNHKEWVKQCGICIVDADGKEVLSDKCGLRISGNASRKLAQKSLTAIAVKEFGSKSSTFCIDLGQGSKQYNKLRIHSGGQDLRDTQIREQLVANLAEKCNINTMRPMLPAMIFINDEFYGVGHIEPQYNENYLENLYGLNKSKMEVFDEGGINEALTMIGFENREYDFNDSALRAAFEEKVDVDDFIRYIAFNFMIRNYDWPMNNVTMYRYLGDDKIEDFEISDGRYRFLITDVDVAFKNDVDDPLNMLDYSDENETMDFIRGFLKYGDYRARFENIMLDFISAGLTDELLNDLDIINSSYGDAFLYAKENTKFEDVKNYLENRENSLIELIDKLAVRKNELYDHLYQFYDTGEGYTINCNKSSRATIQVSTIDIDESFNKEIYSTVRACNISTPLYVYDKNDKPCEYIYINGERVELTDGHLEIDVNMAIDGIVDIRAE